MGFAVLAGRNCIPENPGEAHPEFGNESAGFTSIPVSADERPAGDRQR